MTEISIKQKMIISLISIAPGVINSLVTNSLLVYYSEKLGMDNIVLYGIAILIYGIWNAINNPLIGVYVENWEPRSGKDKLKSMMKLGIPIMFAGFLLFTLAPKGSEDWVLFLFLLIGLIIFELGKSVVEVASITFSLMIVTNQEQRSNLVMVMKIIEFIPLALIGIIPVIFLGPGKPYWHALLFILGVNTVMFVFSFFAIFMVEEPENMYVKTGISTKGVDPEISATFEASSKPISESPFKTSIMLIWDSIKSTVKSKPFVILIAFRMFGALFQASFTSNLILMINWVVPLSSDLEKVILMAIGGLIFNLYYIIMNFMVKKWGMMKTIYVCFFVSFCGYFLMLFASNFITLLIPYSMGNMGIAAIYMFTTVMMGDVADNDLVETGKHRYSEFTANFSVFSSFSPAIATFIITLVLQLTGYDGESTVGQIPSAIMGIKIVASVIPLIGLIMCTLMLKFYPLKGQKYTEMRVKFDALKEQETNEGILEQNKTNMDIEK